MSGFSKKKSSYVGKTTDFSPREAYHVRRRKEWVLLHQAKRRCNMNTTLKKSLAVALTALTLAALTGCCLFGPSKGRHCSCDRGTCNGCGPAAHAVQK